MSRWQAAAIGSSSSSIAGSAPAPSRLGSPAAAEAQAYPYTVIEMHVADGGVSEGKLSLSAAIAGDPVSNIFGLWNYAAAPVHLEDVTRVP